MAVSRTTIQPKKCLETRERVAVWPVSDRVYLALLHRYTVGGQNEAQKREFFDLELASTS
ncbi:hypothetical protein LTR49_027385 [Elasticomyces elasticus]|nr:hypothetical protein LTR49_027385 [Elasticomyces elasticus]